MEAELKSLLAVEEEAERLVTEAEEAHRDLIAAAQEEANLLEQQFAEDSRDILLQHMEKAETRAKQTIAELQRHHEEQDAKLRAEAKSRHDKALAEALQIFQSRSEP